MSVHDVTAIRDGKHWVVFIDGEPIIELLRYPMIEPVARDWIALTEDVPARDVALRVRVTGKQHFVED
jgi:hypothetical protein